MKKRFALPLALLILLGIEAIPVGIGTAVWMLSPVLRERAYEAALLPNFFPLQWLGANQLRQYPSRAAALSLIAFLNLREHETGPGRQVAATALTSLRQLCGQSFQPGLEEGQQPDVPDSSEEWSRTISAVNSWAFTAFGPDAFAALTKLGLGLPSSEFKLELQSGGAASGFQVNPGSAADTDLQRFVRMTVAQGDTAGAKKKLLELGYDEDSELVQATMAGDSVRLRELLLEVMEGGTAEGLGAILWERMQRENAPSPPEPAAATESAGGTTTGTEPAGADGATAGASSSEGGAEAAEGATAEEEQ